MEKKRVAIIGTQGVPAGYGGFESLVENLIGENCSPEVEYTVFCSSLDLKQRYESYLRGRLRYTPLHANGAQSVPYDIWSLIKAARNFDTVLLLGISGGLFLPLFKKISKARIVVNIDGLEHRRLKWNQPIRRFLKASEAAAVKNTDAVIADNRVIADYVKETYGIDAHLIAYGGDHALLTVSPEREREILGQYGLTKNGYAIAVCRIEPENNCRLILETFRRTRKPLLFIGNWHHNSYSKALEEEYGKSENLKLVDAIYDREILSVLRGNASHHIHGHSAGGTNPSLVEAMFFSVPILAFDVEYNRETTFGRAAYFSDSKTLERLADTKGIDFSGLNEAARNHYRWAQITAAYEALY